MTEESLATNIDIIPERDVTVIRDPTDVWLLNAETVGDFRPYEQWEKDRRFKAKAICHHPLGRIFYMKNSDDPFGVDVNDTDCPLDDELELAAERPGQRYHVGEGETIWTIAKKMNLPTTKILAHNEIDDPRTVKPGMWLYIPEPAKKQRLDIEYKVLAKPRQMHITHPGGTTKWRFGNVRKWGDIRQEDKPYAENRNIDIYAVAKVPVEGEVAAYYMDRHDLGPKFAETGRPAYTRGFNWQHLGEGRVEPAPKKKPDLMAEALAAAMLEDDRPQPEPAIAPVEAVEPQEAESPANEPQDAVAQPGELPDDYKDTFKYLNVEESSERFRLLEPLDIREMDGAMPVIHRKEGDIFLARGWFYHEGTPYYRLDTKYWYGIPTQYATSVENEAFTTADMTLAERVKYAPSTLSAEERRFERVAKIAGQASAKYNRFRTLSGLLRRK